VDFLNSFSLTDRALTLAGLAPFVLMGCAVHESPVVAATQALPPPSYRELMPVPVPPPRPRPPAALVASIDALRDRFDGLAGIAVRSCEGGWSAESADADRRLPQQSVSKLWVAMTVLDAVDAGRMRLDDPVTVTRADLTLFHQPIAALALKPGGYRTTVRDLLHRALTGSDNTANDRLLALVGGPAKVRAFLSRNALGDIRFGPGERDLQAKTAGLTWQPRFSQGGEFEAARSRLPQATRRAAYQSYVANPPDGASPAAIANALAKLKRGAILSPTSTAYLLSTMADTRTGRARMKAAVPRGWSLGHKTGTGQDLLGRTAGFNDVGILTAPDGRSYAIAVMIGDTSRPVRERQALIQQVVAAVVANHRG
jgi:beta-lactamase class A